MKVTAETLPERQVKLQIEVDDERHAGAMEKAYRKLAPRVQIPGFRPGKAPRPLIEKQIGHHRLLDEAMDLLLPEVYKEALEEQDLNPVAGPSVELVSHEPLVFSATVPLQPVVDLGEYQSIKLPKPKVEVTDEQVETSLTELRRRYGAIEPVERAAQKGDIIRGDLNAEADAAVIYNGDEIEFRLTDEALVSLPGLVDVVAGLKKGDEVEKTAEAPADFQDERLAGKTITYKVKVSEVKEERLAEANDEFAKEVGEGFDSLQALKDRIRQDIENAETEAATRTLETEAVDALVEKASIDYPAVMVEHEVDHVLEDQANLDPRDPRAVELYLQRMGKSEEEVRDSVKDDAARRLRRSLVLSQFAEAENITVDDADVEAEIETMASTAGEQADAFRKLFDSEGARDSLKRSMLTRKTLARLVEVVGTDAEQPAAEEKPARRAAKPRRSAPRGTD
ncbi:MAG TPA: trigger factor [Dehalococcoidia bacterium]|nr:trigger factor [Dehalococcoidia bacterium]